MQSLFFFWWFLIKFPVIRSNYEIDLQKSLDKDENDEQKIVCFRMFLHIVSARAKRVSVLFPTFMAEIRKNPSFHICKDFKNSWNEILTKTQTCLFRCLLTDQYEKKLLRICQYAYSWSTKRVWNEEVGHMAKFGMNLYSDTMATRRKKS